MFLVQKKINHQNMNKTTCKKKTNKKKKKKPLDIASRSRGCLIYWKVFNGLWTKNFLLGLISLDTFQLYFFFFLTSKYVDLTKSRRCYDAILEFLLLQVEFEPPTLMVATELSSVLFNYTWVLTLVSNYLNVRHASYFKI